MCYCLQACEQLTLQLEMGATTCPQASSEHVLPRNLLTGGLCKISHLCATGYKLVCVSTVGYHLLELEDEFINACLFEHRWCGDGLRIGRILFVRSDYPFTDCSLGRAR